MVRRGEDEYVYDNLARRRKNEYTYDALARKQELIRSLDEPRISISNEARKNREKAHHMNLGYVLFLVAALCCMGMALVNYLQIQSQVTREAEIIANREKTLNDLRVSNDETYNRIVNGIDLEEIKRIAIGELGMTYAGENQIETYEGGGGDYLRKVADD